MKIALCLSGHLRTFNHTYQSLKDHIINPLNCDVFLHTWDVIGSMPSAKTPGDASYRSSKTIDYLDDIHKMYNPKYFQIEEEESKLHEILLEANDIYIKPDEKQFIVNHVGYHIGMFYSMWAANDLRKEFEEENEITYDLIIRCRPDMYFNSKLNLNMFINKNYLYVPEIGTYTEAGINDQFSVASPYLMDKYCSIYLSIYGYYKKHVCVARPEALLKYHLFRNKIKVKQCPIIYDLYRLDGSILKQHKFHAESIRGKLHLPK